MRKKSSQQNFPFVPVRRHSINKKDQHDGARKQRNHKKADQNQCQIKAEHLHKSKMSHIRRAPRHFVLSSYPNGAPEEETYSNLQTIPDTTEQMEFDISSATQIGHQLALIGDEFNRRYHRTLEDTLLHLARVVAVSVFQTWNVIKSVIRSFGDVSSNWTKRITGYGGWTCRLPVRCLCQKLVPAALLVAACWWAMNYGL